MAQAKSPELKAKIIAAWRDAETKGETRKSFHERVKGTELEITYGGLERWLKGTDAKSSGSTGAPVVHSDSPNFTVAATLDDVEAAYKKSIETLIASLEEQEQQLHAELERVVSDLARAREKLTKFD